MAVMGRIRSKEEGTWGALWRSLSLSVRRGTAGSGGGGGGSDRREGGGIGARGSVAEGVLEPFFFLVPGPAAFFFLGGISGSLGGHGPWGGAMNEWG